jgi:polyhydroxybutyrate depolymerase
MITKQLISLFVFMTWLHTNHAQTLINETFVFDGNNREYNIYIPAGYDGASDYPVLFNFHGGGDVISTYMSTVDMRSIADAAHFILVYPQAIPDPGNGGATSWMHKLPTTHNDVPFVQAIIDAVSSNYSIDANRIYACGYSLGGEFSYELACQLNDEIAAIGVVARTMGSNTYSNCSPVHPTGIITILGTADTISDYNGISYAGIQYYESADDVHNYWAVSNDCSTAPIMETLPNTNTSDGSSVERYTWSNSDDCIYIEHLKVIDGGHDWPGSFGNMDINASQEIWDFVSRYDINGLIGCASLSTNDLKSSQTNYKIYPNPFSKQVNIETGLPWVKAYKIYNLRGKQMATGLLTSGINTIDLSSLSANIYFLVTENDSIKLIKKE